MMLQMLLASAGLPFNPIPVTSLGDTAAAGTATAGVTFGADGALTSSGSDSILSKSRWAAAGFPGGYIRVTLNSGTAPTTGTTGSWLALSSARSWSWQRATVGTTNANITIEIATDSGGTNVIASKSSIGIAVTRE